MIEAPGLRGAESDTPSLGLRDPKTVGEALRELRRARGLTQQQLANATGVRRAAVSDYERGVTSPNLESLDRLLVALQADLTDFSAALRMVPIRRRLAGGDRRPEDVEVAALLAAEKAFLDWVEALRGRVLQAAE